MKEKDTNNNLSAVEKRWRRRDNTEIITATTCTK
jgi:hypothetical protein